MSDRLALDTNAVVALLRSDQPNPPLRSNASNNVLPLPVAGELYAGVLGSQQRTQNIARLEELLNEWTIVYPDLGTARMYGQLRGDTRVPASTSRRNDLWIAALCIQHNLPLLTNDRGLDAIPGLRTIHW